MKFLFISFFCILVKLSVSQHTIKVRKDLTIEGLYKNIQNKNDLPTYLYFTKEGMVYYSFSKKLKEKRALVKLTLCALEPTCTNYPKINYVSKKKGHVRFTTNANVNRNYFLIYDGQLSNNGQNLSIRKEETNQLIIVNQYSLVEPK